jgi:hypothetical protein
MISDQTKKSSRPSEMMIMDEGYPLSTLSTNPTTYADMTKKTRPNHTHPTQQLRTSTMPPINEGTVYGPQLPVAAMTTHINTQNEPIGATASSSSAGNAAMGESKVFELGDSMTDEELERLLTSGQDFDLIINSRNKQ